jgi:hypothetical protein
LPKLNEEEREFIELSLHGRDDVEIQTDEENLSVVRKPKVRIKRVPGYKKISHWITGLFILPFLLSGAFMLLILRIESLMGSSLAVLSKQELTPELLNVLSEAGFSWLPQFLEIYENRGIIVAATFTIPLLAVAALSLYEVNKNRKDEDKFSLDENDGA